MFLFFLQLQKDKSGRKAHLSSASMGLNGESLVFRIRLSWGLCCGGFFDGGSEWVRFFPPSFQKQEQKLARRNISCILLFLTLNTSSLPKQVGGGLFCSCTFFSQILVFLCLLTVFSEETSTAIFILQSGCIGIDQIYNSEIHRTFTSCFLRLFY